MLITARRRLLRRTGASCWRHRANRQRHKRHLKSSAGFIGGPFTALCGEKGLGRRKRRILRKVFLLFCWSAGICALCAKRRGDGDQTWKRGAAHSVGTTSRRGVGRNGANRSTHCRADL